MKHRMALLFAITTTMLLIPNLTFGQNVNLSGNLNVNDTQVLSTTNMVLSLVISLAEAIIPMLVGAVIGHKSITFWQEKKDRIATKNSIFENYSQSIKAHISLLDNFVERVFMSYIVFQKDEKTQLPAVNSHTSTQDGVTSFLKFPTDPEELPAKRFAGEYRELFLSVRSTSNAGDKLFLDLKSLYTEKDHQTEKLENIKNMIKRSEILVAKFLQSKNYEDLTSSRERFLSLNKAIKTETENFERELVQLKTR